MMGRVSLCILVLVALLTRGYFFLISIRRLPTNTDEALGILQARAIAEGNFASLLWTQPYQFPLESYIIAPFINFLPENALGARLIPALFALPSVFGFYWILCKGFSKKVHWLCAFLVFFPSSYVLIRQTAFFTPIQVTTLTLAWAIPLSYLAWRHDTSATERRTIFLALTGFLCGLALSCYLILISIVLMVTLGVLCDQNLKRSLKNGLIYVPAFIVGLTPYIYSKIFIPGAYQGVTKTYGIGKALTRLWSPTLTEMLPATFGLTITRFPDVDFHPKDHFQFMLTYGFAWAFSALLVLAVLISVCGFVRRLLRDRWPSFEIGDIFLGAIIIALVSFTLAKFDTKPRYLLLVAWYFPFLIAYLYCNSKRWVQPAFVALVLAVFAWNIRSSWAVINFWKKPAQVAVLADLPPVRGIISVMLENDIRHCYSYWWLVYRVNYESNKKVICEQYFNQRFPGWPLPFSDQVQDKPLAFLHYSGNPVRYANALAFRKRLEEKGIKFDKLIYDHFIIYYHIDPNERGKLDSILLPLKMKKQRNRKRQ